MQYRPTENTTCRGLSTVAPAHLVSLRRDQHLGEHGVQWEFSHATAELGEFALVVQGPERVQLLQRAEQRLCRRRVHEVKVHEVVDAQRLQHEHYIACMCVPVSGRALQPMQSFPKYMTLDAA